MTDIDNRQDILDVRDIIERVEDLDQELDVEGALGEDEDQERADLYELLADLKGNGGDHEWKGDWYPVTLIRDSYWVDYAQDYASDVVVDYQDQSWPMTHIDWDAAAADLQTDYTSVDYQGVDYWYR